MFNRSIYRRDNVKAFMTAFNFFRKNDFLNLDEFNHLLKNFVAKYHIHQDEADQLMKNHKIQVTFFK